jgi:RNA polymerase sigma-70 factor, ECF subfamily
MLVNDARRDARFADGAIVLLRDQDRSLWDPDQIRKGRAALDRALELVDSDAERCFIEGRRAKLKH